MRKLLLVILLLPVVTGCSKNVAAPVGPTASSFVALACKSWFTEVGTTPDGTGRDYAGVTKNFAAAASLDPGYIQISKAANELILVEVNGVALSGYTDEEIFERYRLVNAVCGLK